MQLHFSMFLVRMPTFPRIMCLRQSTSCFFQKIFFLHKLAFLVSKPIFKLFLRTHYGTLKATTKQPQSDTLHNMCMF